MGYIRDELIKFKNNLSPNIGSMNNSMTEVIDKLDTLVKYNQTAVLGFDSYYNSGNKDKALDNLKKYDLEINKVKESITKEIKQMLNDSTIIIDKVSELENLNNSISNLNEQIRNEKVKKEPNNTLINRFEGNIRDYEQRFNKVQEDAITLLNKLKGTNISIEVNKTSEVVSLEPIANGEFVQQLKFRASDGTEMVYNIYIPENASNKKLPIHIYLHSSAGAGTGADNETLGTKLKRGYKPPGILIIPQAPIHTSFVNYPALHGAIIELTNKVVDKYNGDKNRISLSGFSAGAIGGYDLIEKYPDYFSAFMPIAGRNYNMYNVEALRKVKIFGFHGSDDDNVTYRNGLHAVRRSGGYMHTFINGGHAVENSVFGGLKFKYADGKIYDPLEWAFMQKKEDSV